MIVVEQQTWVTLIGFASFALAMMTYLASTRRELKGDIAELRADVNSRFDTVDRRFEQVDRRFEQVDRRFEHLEQRTSEMSAQLSAVRQLTNDIASGLLTKPSRRPEHPAGRQPTG